LDQFIQLKDNIARLRKIVKQRNLWGGNNSSSELFAGTKYKLVSLVFLIELPHKAWCFDVKTQSIASH
jgi:hypothetical protein